MAFGISQSVRSRAVQVCTPSLFHQATRSSRVKDVCAQIEDALERKRRGEISQEDYDTMKTRLKSQLPILTPHATFRNGRRLNADAIPSGLSIYDKDHIPDPRGYWEEKRKELRVKNPTVLERILLVHVTPSLEGLRLVFIIPDGMDLARAQRWMSEQLEDAEYDVCVKDLARPSFIVPEDYILYINEAELFKDRANLPQISQMNTDSFSGKMSHTDLTDGSSQAKNAPSQVNTKHYTLNINKNDNRLSGDGGNPALPAGTAIQPAQPGDSHDSDAHHLSDTGEHQSNSKEVKSEERRVVGSEERRVKSEESNGSAAMSEQAEQSTAGQAEQTEQSTAGQAEQAIKEDLNQGGLHRTNDRNFRASESNDKLAYLLPSAAENHLDNSVASEKTGEGFDAPPTLERSGTEHRGGAVTSPSLLRSEGDWGSEVEPSLAKEGRGGLKTSSEQGEESEERREKLEETSSKDSTTQQAVEGVRGEAFPSEYDGIPYDDLVSKLVELLGGEPQHGSRNSFIFTLSCYLRYLCDDNRDWIKAVIPTFGEEKSRAFATVDSACNRKQANRMPSIVRKAVSLCQDEQARGRAANYDTDDFGDIANPDSYFYRIHEMPQKLPKLIKLLISKTPKIYQPAVAQAVFPPLGAHLCDTRFRYIDNVEHEATLMNILCAPTGSGKESITQPINHIMADIRLRDAEQRARERAWKDECNSKGANKDRRDRPEGLVIQEVNIDMTNPAFVLRMKEAENHFLYAKVNELNLFDALKGKTNQHFRIMELAFDLGNYGQDRVGVQSVTETVKVRFNWNACCTPKKCRDYFRRVVTDGPISRISFATIERRPCGSAMPIYGTYDAAFDEELKPYIDNLLKARGLVDCPQALRLAKKLVEENAEFARLSQNYVFENLSFRANVIAYLKACVLYVANGMKWEKAIEDFIRWSERYDLWCKLKLFGQMIYDADGEQEKVSRTAPNGPKNLLTLLPEEFTMEDYMKVRRAEGFDNDDLKRIKGALKQWVFRGYVVKIESAEDGAEDGKSCDGYSYSSIFRKLNFLKH